MFPFFFKVEGTQLTGELTLTMHKVPAPVFRTQSHKSKQRVLDLWSLWRREGEGGFCSLESCSSRTILSFPRWSPRDHPGYRFLRKYLIPKAPTSILSRRTAAKHWDKFLKGLKWKYISHVVLPRDPVLASGDTKAPALTGGGQARLELSALSYPGCLKLSPNGV